MNNIKKDSFQLDKKYNITTEMFIAIQRCFNMPKMTNFISNFGESNLYLDSINLNTQVNLVA